MQYDTAIKAMNKQLPAAALKPVREEFICK